MEVNCFISLVTSTARAPSEVSNAWLPALGILSVNADTVGIAAECCKTSFPKINLYAATYAS
jgi:hypothetical protein